MGVGFVVSGEVPDCSSAAMESLWAGASSQPYPHWVSAARPFLGVLQSHSRTASSVHGDMKVGAIFARLQPQLKTFRLNYSAEYTTFIRSFILSEPQHPLHELRKREYRKRKKEGLWWHVTANRDLSKSVVVRTWCRRRVRNAFIAELKDKGFDEHGKLVDAKALGGRWKQLRSLINEQKQFSLNGSLRFHCQAPAVPAKNADIRKEIGNVLDVLLEVALLDLSGKSYPDARDVITSSQRTVIRGRGRAVSSVTRPTIQRMNSQRL